MKYCEYCESLIKNAYGSGRFCSAQCARGFATKEKRKEINIKIKKWNKINRIKRTANIKCIVCGIIVQRPYNRRKQKTCSKSCGSHLTQNRPEVKEKIRKARLREIEKGNIGYGIKCEYEGIRCDSALEYAFLEWYMEKHPKSKIKRFKGYINNQGMRYQPDFIINDKIIVEVKYETAYIGDRLNEKWKTYVATQEKKRKILEESDYEYLWITNETIGNNRYRKAIERAKQSKL